MPMSFMIPAIVGPIMSLLGLGAAGIALSVWALTSFKRRMAARRDEETVSSALARPAPSAGAGGSAVPPPAVPMAPDQGGSRSCANVLLIALMVLAATTTAEGQSSQPIVATRPPRFESWQPVAPSDRGIAAAATQVVAASQDRTRHALIGGAIGTVAGVVFCTAVSTLSDDSADGGLSFCPLDSYLLIGGAGFALGFAIGWIS